MLQLHGEKRITFWGPTAKFDHEPIFNFDFRGDPARFEGPRVEVLLKPGDMVFFSRGVMHEVCVPEQDSVSVSMTLGVHFYYPLLTVLDLINQRLGDDTALRLQAEFRFWDKFQYYLFDPTRYVQDPDLTKMPEVLKSKILSLLDAKSTRYEDAQNLLDEWWKDYVKKREYSPTGYMPKPPSNREELLKQWEQERLQ